MSKQEVLYVAYKNEPLDEGIDYAIYLSSLLEEDLRVMLLSPSGLGKKLSDAMTGVAFAEAGEHEAAREFLNGGGPNDQPENAASLQNYLAGKCAKQGVKTTVHIGLEATVAVIMNFLKQKKVDLVILSPSVTANSLVLKKLIKFSPRPVVTMARGGSKVNTQPEEEAV